MRLSATRFVVSSDVPMQTDSVDIGASAGGIVHALESCLPVLYTLGDQSAHTFFGDVILPQPGKEDGDGKTEA